jgi:hypothetical protein
MLEQKMNQAKSDNQKKVNEQQPNQQIKQNTNGQNPPTGGQGSAGNGQPGTPPSNQNPPQMNEEFIKKACATAGIADCTAIVKLLMTAMKAGAALMVWVQQPQNFPDIHISKWHDKWKKWWWVKQKQPTRTYGHMTSSGMDRDTGIIYWTCPTRDERDPAEAYGVPVTESQLRQIANSKVKAGKLKADYKALLIVTHPGGQVAVQAPVAVAPVAPVAAAPTAPVSATQSAVVSTPAPAPVPAKKEAQIDPALSASVDALKRVDWGAKAGEAAEAIGNAVESTKGQSGMNRVLSVLKSIKDNTGIDEAGTEAARVFLTTCIAMMLATGSPLLDMTSGDFKVVISGGLSACLNVVVRFLQPTDNQFGVKTKEK